MEGMLAEIAGDERGDGRKSHAQASVYHPFFLKILRKMSL
jgi:hypothetical protein